MAGKGKTWEKLLQSYHESAQRRGLGAIYKTFPEFVHKSNMKGGFFGRYTGKGPPDYIGLLANGVSFVADAKEYKGRNWPFKDLRRHQAIALDGAVNAGHRAYLLLLRTELAQAYLVDWVAVSDAWWRWADQPGRSAPGTASLRAQRLDVIADYSASVRRFYYIEHIIGEKP